MSRSSDDEGPPTTIGYAPSLPPDSAEVASRRENPAPRSPPSGQAPTKNREEPDVLTVREAADMLRVNVKTIYAEIAAGRLPHVMLGRRIIRIPRAVLASLASKSA
jgi:excisionase family DNA binding protein